MNRSEHEDYDIMWIKQNPYETLDGEAAASLTLTLSTLLNEGKMPMKERKAKSAHG